MLALAFIMSATVMDAGNSIDFGKFKEMSRLLLTKYLFQFELASILLLIGIVGISALRKGDHP